MSGAGSRPRNEGLRGFLGKRHDYFCPSRAKVLGVSHRKGFWMS